MRSRPVAHVLATSLVAAAMLAAAPNAGATYAGSNGLIAFDRYANGIGDIFVMNPDGTFATNVTATREMGEFNPSFSADGTRIVFDAFDSDGAGGIYMMNVDGSGRTQILASPQATDVLPKFAPDGTQIALVRFDLDGNGDLWTMNLDGTNERQLTQTGDVGFSPPSWSPDGTKIAITRFRPATDRDYFQLDVYIVDLASGALTRLTTDQGDELNPDFAPDGTRLTYVHFPTRIDEPFVARIVNADGTGTRPVGDGTAADHFRSLWAPDGAGVLVVGDGRQGPTIELFDAATGAATLITREQMAGVSWQPCPSECPRLDRPAATEVSPFPSGGRRVLKIFAEVIPTHVDVTVSIELFRRKDGAFRSVGTIQDQTNKRGFAVAKFPSFRTGRCRAVATFGGDTDHTAGTGSVRFRCRTPVVGD